MLFPALGCENENFLQILRTHAFSRMDYITTMLISACIIMHLCY